MRPLSWCHLAAFLVFALARWCHAAAVDAEVRVFERQIGDLASSEGPTPTTTLELTESTPTALDVTTSTTATTESVEVSTTAASTEAQGVVPSSTSSSPTSVPTPAAAAVSEPASAPATVETYITITSLEPPTIYTNRGQQIIVLSGSNFSSLSTQPYALTTTNVTFPPEAASITLLSDTLLAVTVDTDALSLSGAIYTIGDFGITLNDDPSQSVVTAIRWVDPVKSIATRVRPSRVTVNQGGPVTVVGIDLLPPIGTALCVFNSTSTPYSPATYNPTQKSYDCNAPTLPASGVLLLNMLYYTPRFDLTPYGGPSASDLNRPSDYISTVVNQPLLLYYRAPAPEIVSAVFTGTGAIYVEFDRAITVYDTSIFMVDPLASSLKLVSGAAGRERFGCDKIFANPTAGTSARLWFRNGTSECRVQRLGPHSFRFHVGAAATVAMARAGLSPLAIDDDLNVKLGAVWTAGQQLSQTATGGVVVQGPRHGDYITRPTVRIEAPQLVSDCADVTYDLSRTMGALGRNFESAVFEVRPANEAIQGELDRFAELFLTQNELVYTIPSSLFPLGTHTTTFTLINFLNASGSTSFTTTKLPSSSVPYVTLVGPSNDAPLDQLHTITAEAHPTCGRQRPVAFAWASNDTDVSNTATTVLLQPYEMDVQRLYSFVVKARYTDEADENWWWLNYTFTSELDRIMPATVTEFSAAGVDNLELAAVPPTSLILSTTIFDSGYAPATTQANISDFTCIWSCAQLPDNTPCTKLETGQELAVPAMCDRADITGFLSPGTYAFEFEAVREQTGAELPSFVQTDNNNNNYKYNTALVVNVLDAPTVPMVTITPSSPHPSAWTPYTLTANIDPASLLTPAPASVLWTSNAICNNTTYSTVQLTDPTTPTQFFPALALIPAAQYCFTVTATDASGSTPGSATIIVDVLEPPAAGYCAPNATEGTAYVDVFRYTCAGWVTDPLAEPVFYAFWIRRASDDSSAVWSNLGPLSQSSVLDTVLAPGDYDITVNISDAAGSLAPIQPTYQITISGNSLVARQQQPSSSDAFTFLNASITSFLLTSDYRSAQTNLVVATQDLTPALLNSAYHVRLLDFYAALLDSNDLYLDATSGAPYMVQVLRALTLDSDQLDPQITNRVLELLRQLAPRVDATTARAATCIAPERAADVVAIGDALLASSSSSAAISSALSAVLDTFDTCMYRTLICSQSLTLTGLTSTRTVGITPVPAASSQTLAFCSAFQIPAADLGLAAGECFRYSCGETPTPQPPSDSSSSSLSQKVVGPITSLTLLTSTNTPLLPSALPAPSILITLRALASAIADRATGPLSCAWWDETTTSAATWSTEGCELADVNVGDGSVTCKCDHLTQFAVIVDPDGAVPSPSPSPPQPASSLAAESPEPTSTTSPALLIPESSSSTTSTTPNQDVPVPLPAPLSVAPSQIDPAPTTTTIPPTSPSSGTSPGKIAGLAIGVLLALALLVLVALYLWRRHTRNRWYGGSKGIALPPPNAAATREGANYNYGGYGAPPPARHRATTPPEVVQSHQGHFAHQGHRHSSGRYDGPHGQQLQYQQQPPPPRWDEHLANIGGRPGNSGSGGGGRGGGGREEYY
ncbi:hypothetical protein PhCBS80983_g04992 [Powellomyces hirtus]|uniref:GAIN-B domain-containing protein n=1 Tax=Powellomyces hirtus TaxID=109895 RepID=A0A507DVP9_9FUNG|nr:hypothetical protein PhCBS80983_g04992 [Powellomyces hirtus]